jgi:hypothetical protein
MPALATKFAYGDEVRVVDLGGRERFASESAQEDGIGRAVGRQQFQHDRALERQGLCQKSATARTVPDYPEDEVSSE